MSTRAMKVTESKTVMHPTTGKNINNKYLISYKQVHYHQWDNPLETGQYAKFGKSIVLVIGHIRMLRKFDGTNINSKSQWKTVIANYQVRY